MGIWIFLVYLVVSGSVMFVLLCVNPQGSGPLSTLSRFFYSKVPLLCRKFSDKVLGEGSSSSFSYYALYIFNQPNPVFQALYLALSIGGYIVYFLEGFQYIPNPMIPEFHKYLGSLLYLVALITFFLASTKSPGVVTRHNSSKYQSLFKYDNLIFKPVECRTCKLLKPARSKHCSICKCCVPKCDHHCIWINQCVGYSNYKFFLAFILSHSMICLYGAQLGVLIFLHIIKKDKLLESVFTDGAGNKFRGDFWVVLQYITQRYAALFFVVILCVVIGVVLAGFFIYHLYMIKKNITTNERMKRIDLMLDTNNYEEPPNAYDKGFLNNLNEVLEAEPL